jgi:hypothetical protein
MGSRARSARVTNKLTAVSQLFRQCGIPNISVHYRPPLFVAEIILF